LIFLLVQDLSHDESQHFAALLWSTWKHRNLQLWQGVSETVAQVVDRAIHLVEDWSMANTPYAAAHNISNLSAEENNSNALVVAIAANNNILR
jgi:hypothetical protein